MKQANVIIVEDSEGNLLLMVIALELLQESGHKLPCIIGSGTIDKKLPHKIERGS